MVTPFLKSMRMDLNKKEYLTLEEYEEYIFGSADVVGLMCLMVFVNGDRNRYEELKASAMKLGSAFQKVNFLRDIKHDYETLGRVYFPNVNLISATGNFVLNGQRSIMRALTVLGDGNQLQEEKPSNEIINTPLPDNPQSNVVLTTENPYQFKEILIDKS